MKSKYIWVMHGEKGCRRQVWIFKHVLEACISYLFHVFLAVRFLVERCAHVNILTFRKSDWIMHSIHCTLFNVHSSLYTVHWTRFIKHIWISTCPCTLVTVHCSVFNVNCLFYTVHFTLFIVNYSLYFVQCKPFTAHFLLYSVWCTLLLYTFNLTFL